MAMARMGAACRYYGGTAVCSLERLDWILGSWAHVTRSTGGLVLAFMRRPWTGEWRGRDPCNVKMVW